MQRSLIFSVTALFLMVALSSTAHAGKYRVAHNHDDWNLQSMINGVFANGPKATYLPGRGSGANTMNPDDIVGLYQFVNFLCQGGQAASLFIPEPNVLLGAGIACVTAEFVRMGLPPPPPTIINMPAKTVNLDIYLSDPKVQALLAKHGYRKVGPETHEQDVSDTRRKDKPVQKTTARVNAPKVRPVVERISSPSPTPAQVEAWKKQQERQSTVIALTKRTN